MQAKVFNLDGSESGSIALPSQFEEAYRPEVIRRAFWAFRSLLWQPKGVFPLAGKQNTAEYFGRRASWRQTINTGRSRLPREKLSGGRLGRVLTVPHAVKGRRAHPPKPEKILVEKINRKEKNLALRSAIAATANPEIVKTRGHITSGKTLPIVADDSLESVKKTKDVEKFLIAVGLEADVSRSEETRSRRSGVRELRKGGYRERKSVLIVYGKDGGIGKAARNIPGVDCADVEKLNADLLAPGGVAGRVCVWTKGAIEKLSKGLYN
ncbi:TPA: 50S ribosomal protein L4 [Candidatus Micrarchaeota archaeon]|nr:50S ribosomal protein L4P [uncultured archaeon]HIH19717.1 50S ribosomal protein L4 [Candidatus Micrarchaeota archaeon]